MGFQELAKALDKKPQSLMRMRIHLDEVEELGSFVELEVVLKPGQAAAEGERIARDLLGKLGLEESALVADAYIDLLEKPRTEKSP